MAATIFATPINNVSTRLGSAHAPGSGRLSVATGDGLKFPPLTSPAYYRVTVLHAAVAYQPYVDPVNYAIFKVVQVQGDDLIVSGTLDGTTDKTFNIGDVVEVRVAAGTIQDLHAAVNAIETNVVSDKYFAFTQMTPASTWTINHNLNKRPVVVTVDSTNRVVVGEVQYVDSNNVTIAFFGGGFAGQAFLN